MRPFDVIIFAALDWEAAAARESHPSISVRLEPRFGSRAWTCILPPWRGWPRPVFWFLVYQTGVGPTRAAAVAAAAPEARAFLSVGCAGGLSPTLRAGDLVLASEIVELDQAGAPIARWPAASGRLAHGLLGSPPCGPVATSRGVLADVRAKAKAAECGALAVAMEDAALAAAARARGIPFFTVRAVLDEADETVPHFGPVIDAESGSVRPWYTLLAVGGRPDRWAAALRLARRRRQAAQRLRWAMRVLLSAWRPEWSS